MALTSAAGCQLSENSQIPCVVAGHDFGGLLQGMATSIRFVAVTIPLAVLALIVWHVVLHFTSRRTEPMVSLRQIKTNNSLDAIGKFPGPLTLGPPLKGRLLVLLVMAGLTVLCVDRDTTSILVTAFFGAVTMAMVLDLIPGSGTIRLDASSFEITRWFRRRRYLWSDVGNFATWGFGYGRVVTFKDKTLRLGIFGRMNAALLGGRTNALPNFFAAPDGVARFMNAWREIRVEGG